MAVTVAVLEAVLRADTSSFDRSLRGADTNMAKFSRAAKVGALAAGTGIAYGLGKVAKIGWDEFNEGQKVAAQTNAVLESTGGVANVTAKQVDDLAVSLMEKSGVDDELIKSGENMLLTFKGVRDEVGKGNDIFSQATETMLDMSVALGQDTRDSAMQLGKALNDPIRGMAALRRVGVTFTEKQEKLITKLQESGDTLGAQKVILKELRTEFGKSAEAAGDTLAGKIAILRERFNNWAGDMVGKVIPMVEDFATFVGDIFSGKGLTGEGLQTLASKIRSHFAAAFNSVDWEKIGARVGAAISAGIVITGEMFAALLDLVNEHADEIAGFMEQMLEVMMAWVEQHSSKVAEIGVVILAKIFMTMTDAQFWAKHWELALAVALSAGGKGFGKIGGKLGGLLVKAFGDDVARSIGKVVGPFAGAFAKAMGKVFTGGFWRRALQIAAYLTGIKAIKEAFQGLAEFFMAMWKGPKEAFLDFRDWAVRWALNLVLDIVEPFTEIPDQIPFFGDLGDAAQKAKDRINAALEKIDFDKRKREVEAYKDSVASITTPKNLQVNVDAAVRIAGTEITVGMLAARKSATGGIFKAVPGGMLHIVEGGHDEAVVSLDPKHKKRSLQIVSEVLKRLYGGRDVLPGMEAGGIATASSAMRRIDKRIPQIGAAIAWLVAQGGVPAQKAFAEAQRMTGLRTPYLWGGGHAGYDPNGPWDCSGGVSQVLHAAGVWPGPPAVVSGFTGWGKPGSGALEIHLDPGSHMYMNALGKTFGTSSENPGGGFGGPLSYRGRPGFSVRHYDRGGWLQPGWTLAGNFTGRPEPVGMGGNVYNFNGAVLDGDRLLRYIREQDDRNRRNGGRGLG